MPLREHKTLYNSTIIVSKYFFKLFNTSLFASSKNFKLGADSAILYFI
ncbi:uncharacterized protein METZ01_LOCUS132819 [marine metagenome]|uniref:Uncharacterized protein n=1 Tax=marine metagenome TaxID=408172 RepID=A0A381YSH8_9ZZZZ